MLYFTTLALFENFCKQEVIDGKEIPVKVNNTQLTVKIASIPSTQMKGLSGSPCPSEKEGMLFVFGAEQPLQFWMADLDYPIDIIFFDKDKKQLGPPQTMEPSTNPTIMYKSDGSAMYALEVAGGWAKRNLTDDNSILDLE